ncbi:MAG: sigma 54-dependent Fis family transcriptional regulator [Deltaproteobacteria bacterium]|nr:sigma 54-dependent Fis family transcriptional regulator [Deltaproteobacteria bacterium]
MVPVKSLNVTVCAGPDSGKSYRAKADQMSIGSAKDNDLVLTDETVSRYHLELHHLGDAIRVQDLGSTNGTTVANVHLERATIQGGTVLTLGRSEIRIDGGETVRLEIHEDDTFEGVRGRSPSMRKLMATIQRVAQSDASILLLGETGVGKEVISQAIHDSSKRADRPLEIVDCGALSPTLIASELFGHERGAFTGADRQHIGAFERANGGTIFLDEIGELPASLQTALLGALERGSFRRVGGSHNIDVDVRVIAATNRDLRVEVNSGNFRQDLYYRIAVVLCRIPPLRERVEDIPILVEHFLREAGFNGDVGEIIPRKAMEGLRAHRWPGNVRELRNFVDAALAMGEAPPLDRGMSDPIDGDVSGAGGSSGESHASTGHSMVNVPLETLHLNFKDARAEVIREFEAAYLKELLKHYQQNVSKAAHTSEIHRSYLNLMLKRHKLR